MNLSLDQLASSITGKSSLNDCSATELKQLANQYPYFTPLHLLLAKKLQQEELSTASQYHHRAKLYFRNPLWFESLMNDVKEEEIITESAGAIPEAVTREETVDNTESSPAPEEIATSVNTPAVVENNIESNESGEIQTSTQKTFAPVEEEKLFTSDVQEEPTTFEEVVDQTRSNTGFGKTDDELPLKIPGLKIEPINPATAEFTFEPYHTVDYFASQGIKIRDDDRPKDKFTQQLKSFTEWLKIMKRVPANELVKQDGIDQKAEQKVEQMAETSITDREVVTEAMAEVWEKQGNKDKALETYRKLSLLDPTKSSYFAAKIDQLKHS